MTISLYIVTTIFALCGSSVSAANQDVTGVQNEATTNMEATKWSEASVPLRTSANALKDLDKKEDAKKSSEASSVLRTSANALKDFGKDEEERNGNTNTYKGTGGRKPGKSKGGTPATDTPTSSPTDQPTDLPTTLTLSVCDTWTYDIADALNKTTSPYQTDVVMIDMEDTDAAVISQLKGEGKKVSCYISAGSWEIWRSDAANFTEEIKGNELYGWEGERWVDVRSNLTREIMSDRMSRAAEKGCDLLEADNVDGYYDMYWNMTGFNLTEDDSKDYLSFLATTAHVNGLLIGLKNCAELAEVMQPMFDFSIVESCAEWDECHKYSPFVANSKPVFAVEYETSYNATVCNELASLGFTLIYSNYDVTFNDFCPRCTY